MSGRISTGQDHQRATAEWAKSRLSLASGRHFIIQEGSEPTEQRGVILADGVGMGKTWEALAAAALILEQSAIRRKDGRRRANVNRQLGRILVLCPPGLVTKWSREVRAKDGFRAHLDVWAKGMQRRTFIVKTLARPFELRRRIDLNGLPKPTRQSNQTDLAAGVFVCNWNLVRGKSDGRTRLAKLPRQAWDIVIVDEAHHREARQALRQLRLHSAGIHATLLLTATPFQLEPHEFHEMFKAILNSTHKQHKLLLRKPIVDYVRQLDEHFKDSSNEKPTRDLRQKAEAALRQLVARTSQKGNGRQYFLIAEDGSTRPIPKIDTINESDLAEVLRKGVQGTSEFEAWYLKRRLEMAKNRTFMATGLRQLLSTPEQSKKFGTETAPYSPKLEALCLWAERQFFTDLCATARDGQPRKTLVFTTFVAGAKEELEARLTEAFMVAHERAALTAEWKALLRLAPANLASVVGKARSFVEVNPELQRSNIVKRVLDDLAELEASGHPLFPMFGSKKFCRYFELDLFERIDDLVNVLAESPSDAWQEKFHRNERKAHLARLEALRQFNIVSTYTGHDDQRDRDQAGEGFRSPLAPWVLVASNVGSEGIDLHTFAAHLVHFDIEWNPARMEQREGRTDRLGRKLKTPVNVHFILVRDTYDERMLYQLVARQRWHSVLLGSIAEAIQKEIDESKFAGIRIIETKDLTLNLKP